MASRIVSKIEERTLDNIDKRDQEFKEYSASYKKSLVYKIYGKTSTVNLRLTGEMLASMKGVVDGYVITVKFRDEENAAKAHGHINGGGNLPVRDFLGLPEDVLKQIMKDSLADYSLDNIDTLDIESIVASELGKEAIAQEVRVGRFENLDTQEDYFFDFE